MNKTTPQVYNGHFFANSPFVARQQVATISDVRNQETSAPRGVAAPKILPKDFL
jgi:hypothetical protein